LPYERLFLKQRRLVAQFGCILTERARFRVVGLNGEILTVLKGVEHSLMRGRALLGFLHLGSTGPAVAIQKLFEK
jgi:hypothetical protein